MSLTLLLILFSGLKQGQVLAACCCGERGLSIRFSACYFCPPLRKLDDNRTERAVDTAVCVNQHPSVRSRQSLELINGGMS